MEIIGLIQHHIFRSFLLGYFQTFRGGQIVNILMNICQYLKMFA